MARTFPFFFFLSFYSLFFFGYFVYSWHESSWLFGVNLVRGCILGGQLCGWPGASICGCESRLRFWLDCLHFFWPIVLGESFGNSIEFKLALLTEGLLCAWLQCDVIFMARKQHFSVHNSDFSNTHTSAALSSTS